ncbi:lysoplasmalogenase [Xenorhabdus thuongxuanensis]|uniref:Membrane protein n=1 Tax=Xenorhabdus thuongxuanensis TaxID=1873484 RepID=A0A1Q5TYY1_9GAMM|nr:lysoplasmalogenase [Xenorhabdus thuongxuanensis]OKP05440.1 membrane protein [Xenorhabdus thuongxuanensis]
MSWPFLAVFFSGWLYIDAAYRGTNWQQWVFRPVTMLLLLLWAYQAPNLEVSGYLIIAGLLTALLSDALRMLPGKYLLFSFIALFLSYLLYTISFALHMSFSFFFPLPLILLVIGIVVILTVWTRLDNMRWRVVDSFVMALLMVWVAGEQYFSLSNDSRFSVIAGAILLLLAHSINIIAQYRFPFKLSKAIVATCGFIGHFLIIRSLFL